MRRQWPFWVSGLFVGIAEIMNYSVLHHPIGLTTGLVEMTSAMERTFVPGADWWSGAYRPNVHWIIIGVVVGAWLVARAEGESRSWRKYPVSELVLAFAGGFVFSFGTRLAGGCTTHHFLGGIPSMSIASLLYLVAILPAGFVTFYMMSLMGIGHVFKGQENRATCERGYHEGGKLALDGLAWDASRNYNPNRDPVRIVILAFMFVFFANAIIGSFVHGGANGAHGWGYAISAIGLGMAVWMFLTGAVAGVGMAKAGFGTECAFMTPEVSMGLNHKENFFEKKWLIPGSTRVMFRAMSPFTAMFVAIFMLWSAEMIGWQLFGIGLPSGSNSSWMLLVGAACQGFGSVAMIGCEIRTYMRLGMGYMTAVAAFPGFLLGYLPYTLHQSFWEGLKANTTITTVKHVPDLFGSDPVVQAVAGAAYGIVLLGLLVWSIERGMRLTGFSFRELMTLPNDALTILYFERGRKRADPVAVSETPEDAGVRPLQGGA
ncbi:MAG: YeeE/YedE family protein [Hyphomicrobiales bacterium]|nr:YeeE/YedE family protein [Hyphomicrobiales bacterium]